MVVVVVVGGGGGALCGGVYTYFNNAGYTDSSCFWCSTRDVIRTLLLPFVDLKKKFFLVSNGLH